MGLLDVTNGFLGNFYLTWAEMRWFSEWCEDHELPEPFIGWVSGLPLRKKFVLSHYLRFSAIAFQ